MSFLIYSYQRPKVEYGLLFISAVSELYSVNQRVHSLF